MDLCEYLSSEEQIQTQDNQLKTELESLKCALEQQQAEGKAKGNWGILYNFQYPFDKGPCK